MSKHGKKYRAAAELIEPDRAYETLEGFQLLEQTATTKFDPTVDVAFKLGVDPRKADQMIRGAISLPHGTGKTAVVAVITGAEHLSEARDAGADHVGGDDLVEQLNNGELIDEIDAIVATPDMMGKLGKLGKVLGPRGLMPNPKSGTVTQDVAKAVGEIKGGRVEYRTDRQANVHAVLGRASFGAQKLADNYQVLHDEIVRSRPSSAKGRYVRSISISCAQGPAIRLQAATESGSGAGGRD